jgi:hypothetical protein
MLMPAAVAGARQQQPATAALVFDNVTVVDVAKGKLLPNQRVVITGNRIKAMGAAKSVPVPDGAQTVEARGKFLIPGLWDMHTHSMDYASDVFYPLFIANGVTGIRDAASPVPLDTMLMWRREILAGTRVGPPRQLLSGKSIDEEKGCVRAKFTLAGTHHHTCVRTDDTADMRQLVDSLKGAGADMIKTYMLSKKMYLALAADARRSGIPFGGHIQAEDLTAIEASDSGASILDHLNSSGGVDTACWGNIDVSVEHCRPVADHFRRNNTWWVLTLTVLDGWGSPYADYLATHFIDDVSEFWGGSLLRGNWLHSAVLARPSADLHGSMTVMSEVELPILAGTDAAPMEVAGVIRGMETAPPGFSLHAELAMYVTEGLTPLAALQTATLNPAKFLRATDSLGTVAPGKLADLVLLDANPLADITNTTAIQAVVANGRYFDRAALDSLLVGGQKAKAERKAAEKPNPKR